MWIPLVEKEFDLNLVQLRADGSFHIPVIKQSVLNAPFEMQLMEYSVNFKKTDQGNELHISRKGKLAKRLKFDGQWSRYQENEDRKPNQSTPIPGAPRKQLSLADEKSLEEMWRENYEFRMRAYAFLKSKWDEADEYGVHLPDRFGHKRGVQFLYKGLAPFVVACLALFFLPKVFDLKNLVNENRVALNDTLIAAKSKSKLEMVKSEERIKRLEEGNQQETTRIPSSPSIENDGKTPKNDKTKIQIAENDNTNQNKDKDEPRETSDPIDGNKRPSKYAKGWSKIVRNYKAINLSDDKKMQPEKREPVIPLPETSWTRERGIAEFEVGDDFPMGLSIKAAKGVRVRLFYHVGPWEEGKSKLIEFDGDEDFDFELEKKFLTNVQVDEDGMERGTVAVQFLATNNESPYEKDDDTEIKDKYRAALLYREKEPIRVFINQRPYFTVGNDVAQIDSGPIQMENPGANVVVQGGKVTTLQPKAIDPEGENYKSLLYEYKIGEKWMVAKNNSVPIDTKESGKYSVIVRARDKAKRLSKEYNIKYSVNFPPVFKVLQIQPAWPIPGGPMRVFATGSDKEWDTFDFTIATTLDGKKLDMEKRTHFDDEKKNAVPESSILYEIKNVPEGKIQIDALLRDNRHAVSDLNNASAIVRNPNPVNIPKTPKKIRNSLGLSFVEIPAGEFVMGSIHSEKNRRPDEILHGVKLSKPFYIQENEFPGSLLVSLLDEVRSRYTSSSYPVRKRNWDQIRFLCSVLNELPEEAKAGRSYRLPTEAEWEYACRAGTQTMFNTGKFLTGEQAELQLTRESGRFAPNAFGLFDMHGNAAELCLDEYDQSYYWKAPIENPVNLARGIPKLNVERGGAYSGWKNARSASRLNHRPSRDPRPTAQGFRLVCEVGEPRKIKEFKLDLENAKENWFFDRRVWRVSNDTLKIKAKQSNRSMYESIHYVASKAKVSNFEFTCSLKALHVRNNERQPNVEIGIIPRAKLLHDNPPKFGNSACHVLLGPRTAGYVIQNVLELSDATVSPTNAAMAKIDQSRAIGDFNELRIRCQGTRLKIWVNNVETLDRSFPSMPSVGTFAFVCKGTDEDIEITFKDCVFKPLK